MNRKAFVSTLIGFMILSTSVVQGAPPQETGKTPRLHSSLDEEFVPILEWQTENYKVRVDDLGHSRFRYAAWDVDASQSEEPNLVLRNGIWDSDGTGGNGFYVFINNGYTYKCYVLYIGSSESPPGYLIVLDPDGNEILWEPVIEVMYSFI